MHVDCGELRYPGFFYARKQIDHHEFAHKTGLFGNKIFIFYYHLLGYRLFPNLPIAAPKILFVVFNLISATVLFFTLNHIIPEKLAIFLVVLFLILMSYHNFFACFDSIEKYGVLNSILLGYFIVVKPNFYSEFIGFLFLIQFFFFKPTYVFEWFAVALIVVLEGKIAGLFTGFMLSFILCVILSYSRFGKYFWDIRNYFNSGLGLLVYWLKLRNNSEIKCEKNANTCDEQKSEGKRINEVFFFFLSALPGIILLVLLGGGGTICSILNGNYLFPLMLLGATVGLLIQWRFYPYHYIALVPSSIFTFATGFTNGNDVSIPLLFMAGTTALYLLINIIVNGFKKKEIFVSSLMKHLPHYSNRMLAAEKISEKILCRSDDWMLQWGDTPQVNLLVGVPSPAGNESTTPWNWGLSNDKARQALSTTIDLKPKYLVLMIDNINFNTFSGSTGLYYKLIDTVYIENEAFRIFKLSRILEPNKKVSDDMKYDLFMECKKKEPNGRSVWNWADPEEMPDYVGKYSSLANKS